MRQAECHHNRDGVTEYARQRGKLTEKNITEP